MSSSDAGPIGGVMDRCRVVAWLSITAVVSALAVAGPAATGTGAARILDVTDRAREAGLRAVSRTYSATAVDYDRDADEDVWIGYHAQGGRLWSNLGNGTYRRVAPAAWPKSNSAGKQIDRHDCAWADVDRNGRPDAYCSTGRFVGNHVKYGRDNELWLGRRRGFQEVGTAWGVGDVCGRGRQVTFLHANADRYPDLFLGNEVPRADPADPCNKPGNTLPNERGKVFINTGGTGFRYNARFWDFGTGPGSGCAEVIDVDGDGWQDLLTCGAEDSRPQLYRNRSGHGFTDASSSQTILRRVSDAVVADLDRDGDDDVITAERHGFAYYLNADGLLGAGGTWSGAVPTGEGRSVAVGDADRDGDLDIYGMVGNQQRSNPDDVIWVNDRLSFTPLGVPPAGGAADEVTSLDPRGHGRAEFLALNGFGRAATPLGPIQLLQVTGP